MQVVSLYSLRRPINNFARRGLGIVPYCFPGDPHYNRQEIASEMGTCHKSANGPYAGGFAFGANGNFCEVRKNETL